MPREMRMRVRIFAAAALVAALAVVAVGATGASGGSAANSSPSGCRSTRSPAGPIVVAAANAQFKKQHPGVDVERPVPDLGRPTSQKFDATLAGGNAPDVIEMGNTEMTKYMAAGAFQDLTASRASFAELEHLARGPRRVGPLRRQALRRSVLRGLARRHLPHRPVQEGRVEGRRRASREFTRRREEARREEQGRRASRRSTSPGTDWYVAMSFVYDYGGTDRDAGKRQVDRARSTRRRRSPA